MFIMSSFSQMGVSWIFETDRSIKDVERSLEMAGAEIVGPYTVDCLPYTPSETVRTATLAIQSTYILHHSNFPQSSFTIALGDSLKQSPRATCDRGFDLIISKLSSGLSLDQAGKFEVHGQEYRLRDFVVRVGAAAQGTTNKGVIVEVEYEPMCVASLVVGILADVINTFFPGQGSKRPAVIDKSTPEAYTALDTLYQYLLVFKEMRKRSG